MSKTTVRRHLAIVKGRKKTKCRACHYTHCTGCSKLHRQPGGRHLNAHHCPKHCRRKADIKKLPTVSMKGLGY